MGGRSRPLRQPFWGYLGGGESENGSDAPVPREFPCGTFGSGFLAGVDTGVLGFFFPQNLSVIVASFLAVKDRT